MLLKRDRVCIRKLFRMASNCPICFLFSYSLLSSLPSPSSGALTATTASNSPVRRELVLRDISACRTNFFILFVVVHNPFTQRKDSCSSSPIDGTLFNFRIQVTYFKESGSCLMQKFKREKLLASFCWMLDSNSGPH